ncbi:MAG TPA: hypothetical protein VNN25_09535 [Thermoanaerobaculia bacterium]|nr:hypothetical protein [Thermoanaerobaculia bacterium]
MKYISLLVVMSLIFLPVNSYAGCPNSGISSQGPIPPAPNCADTAYNYFDTSCAITSGNVTTGTMSCNNWSANQFTTGSGDADYQMTVPAGHGGSCKMVQVYIDFNDPSAYASDALAGSVKVRHNGTVTYYSNFFTRYGNQSPLSCAIVSSGRFSAADGDTIDVDFWSVNYTGATMKVTPAIIWDN